MAQRESIRTHIYTQGPPRHFLVGTCMHPHSHTHTHTCMNKWYTTPTPYPLLSRARPLSIYHSQFSHFVPFSWVSVLSLPFSSHHQTPCLTNFFHSTWEILFPVLSLIPEWILSSSLTLMDHSLPLKSPIISDGIASMPLIFTKLTIHCQDCAACYSMAVTHLAEPRI